MVAYNICLWLLIYVKRKYSPSDAHILAIVVAVKHFAYITGLYKLGIYTPRTPL